ncbi:MAG: histidine--tRNA ligase [Candidatus Babeliales bacterium]
MINKVRGTQDFIDYSFINELLERVRHLLQLHNFAQIQTPILEYLDLFKRSLGEQTEVITKQMFVIDSEHDEQKICLRPEATAPIMRAFLEHGGAHSFTLPWKVFAIGAMFRHERPQKGRYREFHQCSIEMIGTSSLWHDAELLALLDDLFSRVLHISGYALVINYLGCAQDRVAYKKELHAFIEKGIDGLCEFCHERKEKNILRALDCKNENCQRYYANAPRITDHLCETCAVEWKQLRATLDTLSISYTHLPTLVRGLDYYEKTVFEFVSSNLGAQTAFCGGGRYNGLATQLGAREAVPAIGAGIGIERLMLLLEDTQEHLRQEKRLHVIIPMTVTQYPLAMLLADALFRAGVTTDLFIEQDSLRSMMRKANKLGARYALILGETEQQDGTVVIKDLVAGTQETVRQVDAVAYLKK